MRLLIEQPNHEPHFEQLLKEMSRQDSFDAVLYPEGYVADEVSVKTLCEVAKTYKKLIITGSCGNEWPKLTYCCQIGCATIS